MSRLLFPFLVCVALCSGQTRKPVAAGTIGQEAVKSGAGANPRFEDIAQSAGLTVSHVAAPEKRYIVESVSGGIGLIDCDNDGKLDIVVVNGSSVDRYRKNGGDLLVTLYHQDADLKFTNITQQAGLNRKGWGMGVAVGDYDNDGLPDLYVTGYGGNASVSQPGRMQV